MADVDQYRSLLDSGKLPPNLLINGIQCAFAFIDHYQQLRFIRRDLAAQFGAD
jgi:hypothetical protein